MSTAWDARAPAQEPALQAVAVAPVYEVTGFTQLMQAVRFDPAVAGRLLQGLKDLGAVDVAELIPQDWQDVGARVRSLPLEQRRLWQALGAGVLA